MPEPIKPMHELESHNGLFDYQQYENDSSISSMQSFFMGAPETKTASNKFSENVIEMLKSIYDSKDEIITAAQKILSKDTIKESFYKVPGGISDNALLGLKTQGLICGSGRAVKFTEAGRTALRDSFLKETNVLKDNRSATKFDFRDEQSVRTSSSKDKFTRI